MVKKMEQKTVTIEAPNFKTAHFKIVGTAQLVMNKFSAKAREAMKAKQMAGTQSAKSKGKKEPKDFDACYKGAMHVSKEGWLGMPCAAFRTAMIDACRLTNEKMTIGKMTIFIEADGNDKDEGTGLVRIFGEPEPFEMCVRNETGVMDVRVRPRFPEWKAELRVLYDADRFDEKSIANLLMRAGIQVGIGDGRPFSKDSTGQGWGTFRIANKGE